MINSRTRIYVPTVLALGLFGCANDLRDGRSEGPEPQSSTRFSHQDLGGEITATRVDATAQEAWVYLDLESKAEVSPEVPETDGSWDLGFQRFRIKVNGGVHGAGGVEVAIVANQTFDEITKAPSVEYFTDQPDSDDEDADPDMAFLVNDAWYAYNPADNRLSARDRVYVVKTVEGAYFKIQMTDYYDDAGTSGYPAFRWGAIEPPSGTTVDPTVVEVDASERGTWVYLDVSLKAKVAVADPTDSAEWDLAFSRTQIRSNSGTSGSGVAGAKLADGGATFQTLERTSTLGFLIDAMIPLPGPPGSGEFSGNPVLNDWYDYDSATMTVSTKGDLYVIRNADGTYAKLRIDGYEDGVYTLKLDSVAREVDVHAATGSSTTAWNYFNLRLGMSVDPTEPSNSLEWDLGVQGTKIRTNSGTSGPGEGGGHDPEAVTLAEVMTGPSGAGCYLPMQGHICDCAILEADCPGESGIWAEGCDCQGGITVDTMMPIPGPPGSGDFSGNPVLSDWFDYDPVNHTLSAKEKAFVLRTADGGFVKIKVTGYEDGLLSFEYAYGGAGESRF